MHLLVIGILTAFTPYAWFVSQVCPDIFVGYFALALIGYLAYSNSKIMQVFYLLIIGISMLVHNSILLLGLVVVGIIWLYWCIKFKKLWNKKYATLMLSTVAMYVLASTVNKIHQSSICT